MSRSALMMVPLLLFLSMLLTACGSSPPALQACVPVTVVKEVFQECRIPALLKQVPQPPEVPGQPVSVNLPISLSPGVSTPSN